MKFSRKDLDTDLVSEIVGQPVKSFSLAEGSKKGDNNIGKMLALTAETEEGTTLDVVVKSLLPFTSEELDASTICQSKLFLALQVFPVEIRYYQKVRPLLQQVTGVSWCDKPNILSSNEAGSNAYIALEDLRPQGYKMADKRKGLTLNEATAVLRKLAVLHAHSYAVISQNHPAIQELEKSPLNGHVWLSRFSDLDLERFFNVFIEKMMELMREIGEVETARKMERFVKIGYKLLIDLWEKRGQSAKYFRVVLHGDLWTNNVLFKHLPDGETVEDLVFIDFQQCRFGTIYEDLLYFIFTSTTVQFRKQHLKACLQAYFNEFKGTLESLQNPVLLPAGFSEESLIATFYENIEYGFCYDVVAIPFQLGRDEGPPPDEPGAVAPPLNEDASAMQLALMTSEAMKLETKHCQIAVQRLKELCAEMVKLNVLA